MQVKREIALIFSCFSRFIDNTENIFIINLTVKNIVTEYGDPKENRTPIARMKTWCPNR